MEPSITSGYRFNVGEIYVLRLASYISGIKFGRVIGFTNSNNPRFEILPTATTILEGNMLDTKYRVLPGSEGIEVKVARLSKDGDTKSWYVTLDYIKYRVSELYNPSKKYEYTHYH